MSVHITGKLTDYKSTEMIHTPSGAVIKTTAPIDNGGDGSLFSPTDLCAASLGACTITVIGLYAHKHKIHLEGITFSIRKEMSKTAPRRISELIATFELDTTCSSEEFETLVRVGESCPIRHTLTEDTRIKETYIRKSVT